jgi:hypothetical protein
MDERQEDTLHGAVRDTGTLPTESEQAEPARPPTADLTPTGTVGAAPEERAATSPRVPGETAAGSIAGTRGVEPGAEGTRS